MKVDTGGNQLFFARHDHKADVQDDREFSSMVGDGSSVAARTGASAPDDVDFTSMTRQELFDWMNGQIRDGSMTLDESSSFLGMTIKIDAATGQPVDMAMDTTEIDFTANARAGIEGALSRADYRFAEQLRAALGLMLAR